MGHRFFRPVVVVGVFTAAGLGGLGACSSLLNLEAPASIDDAAPDDAAPPGDGAPADGSPSADGPPPDDGAPPGDATGAGLNVTAMTPPAGAASVERNVEVRATFSRDVDAATIDATTFRVTAGGVAVAGQVRYEASTRTAVFVPDLGLALMSAHTATLAGTVRGADGTTLGADRSWTFTVREGAWDRPMLLDSKDSLAQYPRIAVNARGDAVTVWGQDNLGVNYFSPATGWSDAIFIDNQATPAGEGRVTLDERGNAVAVWLQGNRLWRNRGTAAGWGTATPLLTTMTSFDEIDLAGNAAGTAAAVWMQPGPDLYLARYDGTWGAPVPLEKPNGHSSGVVVDIDRDGRSMALWTQAATTSGPFAIWARYYDTVLGAPVRVEPTATVTTRSPEVAFDGAGNAFAIWIAERPSEGPEIRTARFTRDQGWKDARALGVGYIGSVAADAAGHALALWVRDGATDTDPDSIWFSRYTAGTGWTSETAFAAGVQGAGTPQIVFDPRGNAIAIWTQFDNGARHNLWWRRFTPAGSWSKAVLIELDDQDVSDPRIGIDAAGNAIVVWTQFFGGTDRVFATRLH